MLRPARLFAPLLAPSPASSFAPAGFPDAPHLGVAAPSSSVRADAGRLGMMEAGVSPSPPATPGGRRVGGCLLGMGWTAPLLARDASVCAPVPSLRRRLCCFPAGERGAEKPKLPACCTPRIRSPPRSRAPRYLRPEPRPGARTALPVWRRLGWLHEVPLRRDELTNRSRPFGHPSPPLRYPGGEPAAARGWGFCACAKAECGGLG